MTTISLYNYTTTTTTTTTSISTWIQGIGKTANIPQPTASLPSLAKTATLAVQALDHNRTNFTIQNSFSTAPALCEDVQMDNLASKAIQTILYCLIILLALCGNCLVIAIVVKNPNMRTPIHYLITNMAVSDVLVPFFILPMKFTQIYVGRWLVGGTFGLFLCKMLPFLSDISTAVSIESLVIIAVDRFFAVVFPMRKPIFTTRRIRFVICLTWFIAAVVHSPYLYIFTVVSFNNQLFCVPTWTLLGKDAQKNYFFGIFSLLFAVPITFITILYSAIAKELNKKADCGDCGTVARRRRTKENKSVTKMMVAVVLVFVVSYAPSHVRIFCHFYAPFLLQCNRLLKHAIIMFIAHCNCAANPIIYFIFSKNYLLAAKKMITRQQPKEDYLAKQENLL